MDDLLDSDEPCCQWEAVAKRQEKKIKRLESDLAMMQETMKNEVQFLSEITKKPKLSHSQSQTEEQAWLHLTLWLGRGNIRIFKYRSSTF